MCYDIVSWPHHQMQEEVENGALFPAGICRLSTVPGTQEGLSEGLFTE